MFKKLVLILATVAAAGPALAVPFDDISDTFGDPFYDPMAECECQRYGFCPEPAPPPPPPPKK